MEPLPDQSTTPSPAATTAAVPRRRFVQSTLFPVKPHPDVKTVNSAKKQGKKFEEIHVFVDDDNDNVNNEECCGSQGKMKKKRGRPPKQPNSTPTKRRSKKVADASVIPIDDMDSPKQNSTPQKRRSKKATGNGEDAPVISIDDMDFPDDGTPQKLKEKQRSSSKNGKIKTPTRPKVAHQVSQHVPDLWQEAKRTAEENSRIFAGKQIHPFFSSRKGVKKDQDLIEVETYECLGQRKGRNAELGPIHVFEDVKDDIDPIDWSNWTFYDGSFSMTTSYQEGEPSSLGGIVGSDSGLVADPCPTSLLLQKASLSQNLAAPEKSSTEPGSASSVVVDVEIAAFDLLKNIEKELEANQLGFVPVDDECIDSEVERKNVIPERMSYYLNRVNQPESSLWTNKYQPEKASEVCGNSEAVKFINDWLHLWHAADFRFSKRSGNADKFFVEDDEYDSYGSDSDVENSASGLKNVLLVTGPVGCGKSAAIYACAKEQGFQVIEVNASDWRNGALLKQKFGEAVESHWLKRSQEKSSCSQSKLTLEPSPAELINEEPVLDLNNVPAEVISLSEDKEAVACFGMQSTGNGRLSCDQGEIKTLLLFEDADANLFEDRGFMTTIQQLADTGKRPMILTSNNENPELPDNLDREEVCFTMPSLKDLIRHLYLVCAAEKTKLPPHLIERCVEFCRRDIRKTLLHLQFWCQSKGFIKDGRFQCMYSQQMSSLEAGHCTFLKLIPWGLPSPLSEFVEAEITKSLCKVEEDQYLFDVLEEEGNLQNSSNFDKIGTTSIEAKKEAILRNCVLHDDFSTCSGSPIAFARRNVRRKLDTVLSSDSEEEMPSHEKPAVSNSFFSDINNNSVLFHSPVKKDVSKDLGEPETTKVEEVTHQSSDAEDAKNINLSVVENTLNQSTDLFLHSVEANYSEVKHQCPQLLDLNTSNWEESREYSTDWMPRTGEVQMAVNGNEFPQMPPHNQNSSLDDPRNQSTYQPIQFEESNVAERDGKVAANRCLSPLSDQLKQFGDAKRAVGRCLFPHAASTDPISCRVGRQNQPDKLLHCRESIIPEHQHLQMEGESVDKVNQGHAYGAMNPFFEHLPSCGKLDMDNTQQQESEIASVNPRSYAALDGSLNLSGNCSFHPVEAKRKEIQQQHPKPEDQSQNICAGLDYPLYQSGDQYLETTKLEEIQQQDAGTADVNHSHSLLLDGSMKHFSNHVHCGEAQLESALHQFFETSNVNFPDSPAVTKSISPLSGKRLKLVEAKAEGQQHPFSDATNFNHRINRCRSIDVSCVPESTFVEETEVNDGTEFQSTRDLMEIVSPVTIGNVDTSMRMHEAPENGDCGSDNNVYASDEMGDFQIGNDHLEASTSGCQVMDECSRMDFYKRSKHRKCSYLQAKNAVQERWNELRLMDLREYFLSEHKNALQVVDLASGICNFISEGDLLLNNYDFVINESSDQDVDLRDKAFSFGWHTQQVQMALTIEECGNHLYAKDFGALQSSMGTDCKVPLAWEILSSTSNSMTSEKLLGLDKSRSSLANGSLRLEEAAINISFTRERETVFHNIVQSIIPLRCYLTVRGNALHEYLSSLALISRSEVSRLAEAVSKTKRRRVRGAKNYLSSCALDLSPNDITLLNEYSCYGKSVSGT